ncbi:O-antigen ligase family protein [Microvirga solisilvae]|uniref:O-antigen ligase family protein n=1 Tax=Microvirga solisilvae TaxID=2919498 RepID=UPI001FAF8E4B|nr:O-antigen ligase family protein [Microvirga solisilvae]
MALIDTPPMDSRRVLADGFWRAAVVTLALLPVGMAIAHRSSPVYVILSAVLCLIASGIEGRLDTLLRNLRSALLSPLGLAVIAFFVWGLMSIGWSEFRLLSLRAFGEFWLPISAVLVLALLLPEKIKPPMFWLLAGAFVLAAIIMLVELKTGMALRRAFKVRSDTYIFNRPVLTLLMLILPLTAWVLSCVRRGWIYGLGLLALLAVLELRSESEAAMLGLAIVCIAFPLAWFLPRLVFALAGLGFLAAFCLSPFIGFISAQVMTPAMHQQLASGHSKDREQLWQSFGYVVQEDPLLGGGFGVSPRMPDTEVAQKVPATHRRMLNIGHPHNAALQIWVELGVVGAVLSLLIAFLTLRSLWNMPHLTRSASMALMAGAAPVALVGHGAWQGWWAASLGAAIIWMQAASRFQAETKPCPSSM